MAEIPSEPPVAGDETATLIGSLERQRAIFAWKCGGLDAAGLRATVGASTMTLGGLLKHLALCEDFMSTKKLTGDPLGAPWEDMSSDDDDWEFTSAADDKPEELYALWDGAVVRFRERFDAVLAKGGLDQPVHMAGPDGQHASVRRLICDFIEEYGRHTGHADLLREAVDGVVGEDPPAGWRPVIGRPPWDTTPQAT